MCSITTGNKPIQRNHSFSTSASSTSSLTRSPVKLQRSNSSINTNNESIKMEIEKVEPYKSELTPNTSSIQKKKYENPVIKDKLVTELKQKLYIIS